MNHARLQLIARSWINCFAGLLVFSSWFGLSSISAAPCKLTSAQRDSWVETKVTALVRAARVLYEDDEAQPGYERVLDEISRTIKLCRLDEDSDFVGRYPEFVEYVKLLSLSRNKEHALGFLVSDKEYFAATSKYTTIPDFLLAPSFVRSASSFETLPQAKAQLREMNAGRSADDQLLFFSYVSRHLGTPDNEYSFRRLLIVVPGNYAQGVPEKWVQFGIPNPRARKSVRNVSVVAVVPVAGKTVNVYFKDFYRKYGRKGSITISGRWEQGYGDDNCVQCHKSGVLPIFPVNGSVSPDEQPVLEEVNERFLTYGSARFEPYLDASKFGPGLGSPRPSSEAGAAMFRTEACVNCHHANGLGSLSWPMDEVLISSFVKGGKMPLGVKLKSSERAKLYKQLIDDYFDIGDARPGILKAWLLGKSR